MNQTANNYKENLSLVYQSVMAKVHDQQSINQPEGVVYYIESLSQELYSGVSFEQYFRWAGPDEVNQIWAHIAILGFPELQQLVQTAIKVAFPGGVANDDEAYEGCMDGWSESQLEQLDELYEDFEELGSELMAKLGTFIINNKLL